MLPLVLLGVEGVAGGPLSAATLACLARLALLALLALAEPVLLLSEDVRLDSLCAWSCFLRLGSFSLSSLLRSLGVLGVFTMAGGGEEGAGSSSGSSSAGALPTGSSGMVLT
uniref:Putative secreted protein n=1 Tax=Ixodes ricinus TaxID=34613 RepID=A0A6B0UJJ3_IXORI